MTSLAHYAPGLLALGVLIGVVVGVVLAGMALDRYSRGTRDSDNRRR